MCKSITSRLTKSERKKIEEFLRTFWGTDFWDNLFFYQREITIRSFGKENLKRLETIECALKKQKCKKGKKE